MKSNDFLNDENRHIGNNYVESVTVRKHSTLVKCNGGNIIMKAWKKDDVFPNRWNRVVIIDYPENIVCTVETLIIGKKWIKSDISIKSGYRKSLISN